MVNPVVVDVWLGAHHDSGLDSSILGKKRLPVIGTFFFALCYDQDRLTGQAVPWVLHGAGTIEVTAKEASNGQVEDPHSA